MKKLRIYTDGSYSSARKQGGIGIVFVRELEDGTLEFLSEASKGYKDTTNNKMEVQAILMGINSIVKEIDHILIISDSMYAIGSSHLGELKYKRKKNIELLKKLDEVVARKRSLVKQFSIEWVKGHYEDVWNERADKLAVEASQQLIV